MSTRFSILIPVYNVERYVAECIESVLAQTYTNYEVIIIDDGSTDESGKICDNFAREDNRLVVLHRENQGLISARRSAIKKATGDYYVFLDSDDMLKENALFVINKAIEKYNCDCIIYGYEQFDGNCILSQVVDSEEKVLQNKKDIYRECLFNTNRNPLCRKAVRASVFQDLDYSQYYHLQLREDLLQSLEIYKYSEKIAFISDVLYRYRLNQNSISHNRNDYQPDSTIRKTVLDFIVHEAEFSQNEMLEYRDFCISLLIVEVIKIATLKQSIEKRKQKFALIRNDAYYQDFLKLGITNRKAIGKKSIIYELFQRGHDKLLIILVAGFFRLRGNQITP